MSKEEFVSDALGVCWQAQFGFGATKSEVLANFARAAIAAADKWDAEQRDNTARVVQRLDALGNTDAISPGLDSAIQDELDRPPAPIMEERK